MPARHSPAFKRYDDSTLRAALDLAAHLAYYSVADPTLLATSSAHTSISDYANITRYLTPRGINYLESYIRDQDHNRRHAAIAAELALANLPEAAVKGKDAARTKGTTFAEPFTPSQYRATIDPTVDLGKDGVTMTIRGTCTVRIPGSRNGTPYFVTLTRRTFTYYLQPTASRAYSVGVEGWSSSSTAGYTRR